MWLNFLVVRVSWCCCIHQPPCQSAPHFSRLQAGDVLEASWRVGTHCFTASSRNTTSIYHKARQPRLGNIQAAAVPRPHTPSSPGLMMAAAGTQTGQADQPTLLASSPVTAGKKTRTAIDRCCCTVALAAAETSSVLSAWLSRPRPPTRAGAHRGGHACARGGTTKVGRSGAGHAGDHAAAGGSQDGKA